MANRNFGKNLLLALGSLGSLTGAINPGVSAMESVSNINEHNANHEKFNEILDDALLLSDGQEQYFGGNYHSDWTTSHVYDVCNKIEKLSINKNDLTINEKSKLRLFILKLIKWEVQNTNYGVHSLNPGLKKSIGPTYDHRVNLDKLSALWKSYFVSDNECDKVSKIIEDTRNDLDRFMNDDWAWQRETAREITNDITSLNQLIQLNK